MLLKSWIKEISRVECRPEAQTVHCIAHLDQKIDCVIPYLNTVLGGYTYIQDPPSLTIKTQGKLITVHGDRIAINALQDTNEAEHILIWLQKEINTTWERHDQITPLYMAAPQPQVIKIIKLLPKTNCRKCGQPSCMVFATLAAEGGKDANQCPELDEITKEDLNGYLSQFRFDF